MPDPRDLCDLDSVKALMQKSGSNAASQDSLIQALITRASVKIMRDYGREFVPGGVNSDTFTSAARIFEFEVDIGPNREVFVDLYPYDLQTSPAPTVVMDPDSTSPLTLASTEWRLWPTPPLRGVYEAIKIRLISARSAWPGFSHRQIQITGNWGFPTVPLEATQACAETVIHWITAYPAMRAAGQVDSGSVVSPVTPRSYPMSALDLLCTFKRMTV